MSAATEPAAQTPVHRFYPLTREQLAVPAVPLFRLRDQPAVVESTGIPRPHMAVDSQQPCQDPPRAAAEFTVAVRTQRKSIAKPVKPSTVRLPEVRFSRNAALPSTGGNSELHTSTVSSFAVSPPETRVHPPSAYPYWLVALVQIILGTLLVILLVKFTQLIKDSSQSPSQSRASVAPDAGPWQPRISLLGKADQPSHPALPDPWGL